MSRFFKHIFFVFLYLNIYILISGSGNAQQLTLKIEAEKTISKGLLDSLDYSLFHPDLNHLNAETDTIQNRLYMIGYIDSELLQIDRRNDSLYSARFYLGKKYRLLKVYYSQLEFKRKDLDRISDQVETDYFLLSFPFIETALKKLNAIQISEGNPFAKLQLTAIKKEKGDTLSAVLFTRAGPERKVDSIVVKGYEKFPTSFTRYYAGIRKGRSFDRQELIDKNEALNTLGFAKTIKPPEVLFEEEKTTVFLYLEKTNNNLFDGILGFATNEDTGNLEFNGYLNLELNNNLNFGEQLLINYKADGREQQNFRVKAGMPYLFRTPLGLELELKIFKRDSTFSTTDQLAKTTFQLSPSTRTYAGYKGYESSNLLDEAVAGAPVEDYDSRWGIFGISYTKLQPDRPLFPIKGYASVDAEIGSRETNTESQDQQRLSGIASYIFNLNRRNSVFLKNTTSLLRSDTYLVNELFRFGGITSIRGFDENSLDASFFSVLNSEYRYQFNEGVYVHSVIDLAYFENETIDLREKLYSFGFGIGLQTSAGIFKFVIANGNSEGSNIKFSNTKIHLSLSSRF